VEDKTYMAVNSNFYCTTQRDPLNNLDFIILGCRQAVGGGELQAWILPSHGSNLCRLSLDGRKIIDFDPSLLASDFTGTPVLYPTPNRVRNGVFRYQGRSYPQHLRGAAIHEHGLVHSEVWKYAEPAVQQDSTILRTWIDFDEASDGFQAFPFLHRLSLEFCLSETGVKVTYGIENKSDQVLPFGFGLHPYFMKLGGDLETYVQLPARSVMDYTSDLLPTGRLVPVEGTIYDLRQRIAIGELDLDHVFTNIETGKFAQVFYPGMGLGVNLVTTEDFSHMVLYSPRGAPFFCLENQTCSTDAHNLYDRGFAAESGLKFVQPGKVHSGSVSYLITREL
jgi:aldose 1-epimerase